MTQPRTHRFYVAGPLFNAYEQAFQADLERSLATLGSTFLPQRDCPQDHPDLILPVASPGLISLRLW
ncbi:MAG: hypothetical protein HC926_04365 [Synechococcaceae cyanobacterium SM2_3_60]|nr:hypothetical protein [Synechococcaceae cyanobacterium SM2_3_60]